MTELTTDGELISVSFRDFTSYLNGRFGYSFVKTSSGFGDEFSNVRHLATISLLSNTNFFMRLYLKIYSSYRRFHL